MPKLVTLVALITVFTAVAAYADREFTFNKNDNFDGAAVSSIKIDMPYGDIAIVKSTSDKIEILLKNSIIAHDQSEADQINNDFHFSAKLDGNKLLITLDEPRNQNHSRGLVNRLMSGNWSDDISPALKVAIPDKKTFEINSASADIQASDVAIDLTVESSSSDVSLENTTGDVDCNISSGDVEITGHRGAIQVDGNSSDLKIVDIEGNVDAQTSSGDTEIDKVKGAVRVSTSSGDNRINDIIGNLDVSSSSGDIVVSSVSGSVRADAVSGDIRLGSLSNIEGDFDVESVSGDIDIEVTNEFKGQVMLRSVSGTVNCHLSGDLRASTNSEINSNIGNGKGRLNVASTSGDINIDKF
jgi:hypothetical protein